MAHNRIGDLEAAVAVRQRTLGGEHPETLKARVDLALGYREGERDQDALDTLEEVVALCDRSLGPEHPNTLTATVEEDRSAPCDHTGGVSCHSSRRRAAAQ